MEWGPKCLPSPLLELEQGACSFKYLHNYRTHGTTIIFTNFYPFISKLEPNCQYSCSSSCSEIFAQIFAPPQNLCRPLKTFACDFLRSSYQRQLPSSRSCLQAIPPLLLSLLQTFSSVFTHILIALSWSVACGPGGSPDHLPVGSSLPTIVLTHTVLHCHLHTHSPTLSCL